MGTGYALWVCLSVIAGRNLKNMALRVWSHVHVEMCVLKALVLVMRQMQVEIQGEVCSGNDVLCDSVPGPPKALGGH